MEGSGMYVKFKYGMDLATKTRRGGQSSNRLARIRDEKRGLLIDKIVEDTMKHLKEPLVGGYGELYKEVASNLNLKSVRVTNIEELLEEGKMMKYVDEVKEERISLVQLKEYIKRTPDRCLFGLRETEEGIMEGRVMKIYINSDVDIMFKDVEKIEFKYVTDLQEYGGVVSITWY